MRLGEVIRRWRRSTDLSMREAAAQMGIELSVLHRLETGGAVKGTTLAIVLLWLLKDEEEK